MTVAYVRRQPILEYHWAESWYRNNRYLVNNSSGVTHWFDGPSFRITWTDCGDAVSKRMIEIAEASYFLRCDRKWVLGRGGQSVEISEIYLVELAAILNRSNPGILVRTYTCRRCGKDFDIHASYEVTQCSECDEKQRQLWKQEEDAILEAACLLQNPKSRCVTSVPAPWRQEDPCQTQSAEKSKPS